MKDIPILFSGPMVCALLDGRKTMTRRILKPQPEHAVDSGGNVLPYGIMHVDGDPRPRVTVGRVITRQEVRWAVGDRLWVKENFRNQQTSAMVSSTEGARRLVCIDYSADGTRTHWNLPESDCTKVLRERGRGPTGEQTALISCLNMPRVISRLTLVVAATKIEPLHDISPEDVIAEGIDPTPHRCGCEVCSRTSVFCPASASSLIMEFGGLWRSIHGVDSWDANPVVVAISVNVIKANIDIMPKAEAA